MAIRAGLTSLGFRQLLKLSGAFILNPRYLLPTLRATKETVSICNELFKKSHHGNNRSNAFRHALWNFKISKKCLKAAGSIEKASAWAKKITDLHEELLPNDELAKRMDLHNNRIGRNLFRKYAEPELDIIPVLLKMMKNAQKISDIQELEKLAKDLVFTEKLKDNERQIL